MPVPRENIAEVPCEIDAPGILFGGISGLAVGTAHVRVWNCEFRSPDSVLHLAFVFPIAAPSGIGSQLVGKVANGISEKMKVVIIY